MRGVTPFPLAVTRPTARGAECPLIIKRAVLADFCFTPREKACGWRRPWPGTAPRGGAMGCGASRAVQPDPAVLMAEKAEAEKAAAEKAAAEKAAEEKAAAVKEVVEKASAMQPRPAQLAEDRKATAEFERQLAKARAATTLRETKLIKTY